jgi:periplasmic protein TonB
VFALHAAGDGKSGLVVKGAGKFGLLLVASILAAESGLAAGQTQDQADPPAEPQGVVLPQRVRVSQGVMRGLIVTKVQPKYPEKARKKRIQGTVTMHVLISKDGDVATVELVSGDPLLAPAAMEAVKQWKYKPYLLNGQPVVVDTQIQVNFALTEN